MLNMKKYGKVLLSAYIMKKIKPGKSQKSKGMLSKYGTLVLGAYILDRLKSEKTEKKTEEEMELSETGEGTPRMNTGKILKGALAGAAVLGVLAWSYGFISYKKQNAKKNVHNT